MKNFKKVLAVMTAVSAMAATTSAFAANEAAVTGGVTGTYAANEAGAYKLTVATPATAKTGEDMTLLVLTEGALTDEAVADSEILYIDQGIAGTDNFAGLGLKNEIINAVTTTGHIIKIGYYDADGEFAIAEGTIAVTADAKTLTFAWGDTTLDGSIDASDALATFYYGAGDVRTYSQADSEDSYTVGETYGEIAWGDATLDGSIDASDALAMFYYGAGDARTYAAYTVGETYTVNVD